MTAIRPPDEVLDDHLRCRQSGDVEGDIARNYAEDVVVLSGCGIHRGHDGVRETARILGHYVDGGGGYDISNRLVAGEAAFIEWSARRAGVHAHDGADGFVIRHGRIALQTIHYSVVDEAPEAG